MHMCLDKDGKIKSIDDIDLNLINALREIFINDVRGISDIKELNIKQGNLEVIDFLQSQYNLINEINGEE